MSSICCCCIPFAPPHHHVNHHQLFIFLFIFYSYFYDIYIYIYIYKDYWLYTFIMTGFNITLNFAFTYSSTLILKLFFILTHFILHHMDYYKRYMCLKNQLIKLLAQRSNSEVVTKFFSLYIPSLKNLKGKK